MYCDSANEIPCAMFEWLGNICILFTILGG